MTSPRTGGATSRSSAQCPGTLRRTYPGGGTWKIQGNWSNAAYDNGQTGYAAGGCIDGN